MRSRREHPAIESDRRMRVTQYRLSRAKPKRSLRCRADARKASEFKACHRCGAAYRSTREHVCTTVEVNSETGSAERPDEEPESDTAS